MKRGRQRKRLINCFGFGSSEHGRLGIGAPDEARQYAAAGFPIGWHQPVDAAEMGPVSITNRRARRTHVRGLARLAKLPKQVEEATVGGNGGVVLPMAAVGRSIKPEKPIVCVATGDFHSLAIRSDGRIFGWGCADQGQLGMAPIAEAVRRAEIDMVAKTTKITGHEEKVAVTPQTTWPGLKVWQAALQADLPRARRRTGLGWQEAPSDPPVAAHVTRGASFVRTKGGKVFCWGSNRHNVLGFTGLQAPRPPSGESGGSGGGAVVKDDGTKAAPKEESASSASASPFADSYCHSEPLQVRGPVERATIVQLSCGAHHVSARR